MANPAEEIPVYIDWQFEISAPEDKNSFFKEVKKYQSGISSEMPWYMRLYQSFVRTKLDKKIGADQVTIVYDYSTEEPTGEWVDHEESLIIQNHLGVTIGDILYSLHHETGKKLHQQDIMAIEGLELKEGSESDNPAYYVFFGS